MTFSDGTLLSFISLSQTSISTPGSSNIPLLKAGAELGVYTFLGFAFQSIGLESTTASRSAFLLYLNVKIVPFLSAVFYRRTIPLSTWISALLALCGLRNIDVVTS
jgi:drug/metabolite transporter (DMT)-like permease